MFDFLLRGSIISTGSIRTDITVSEHRPYWSYAFPKQPSIVEGFCKINVETYWCKQRLIQPDSGRLCFMNETRDQMFILLIDYSERLVSIGISVDVEWGGLGDWFARCNLVCLRLIVVDRMVSVAWPRLSAVLPLRYNCYYVNSVPCGSYNTLWISWLGWSNLGGSKPNGYTPYLLY